MSNIGRLIATMTAQYFFGEALVNTVSKAYEKSEEEKKKAEKPRKKTIETEGEEVK